jgi:hypothetical protein
VFLNFEKSFIPSTYAHLSSDIKVIPGSRKIKPSKVCVDAWEELKKQLCNATTRDFPDFFKPFILYVDGSKEGGFGVPIHQIGSDGVERPILFLPRSLTGAETRYWATELETAALVWALTKLPQYFEDGPFTVVTDHSALKSALQTKTTGRRSARLNEWAMFLATYLPRMTIIHRPGKAHLNADDLLRLACVEDSKASTVGVLSIPFNDRFDVNMYGSNHVITCGKPYKRRFCISFCCNRHVFLLANASIC